MCLQIGVKHRTLLQEDMDVVGIPRLASVVTSIRPMMVTQKAANEIDWFRPKKET